MSNFTYTSDIVANALFRAGEPASSSSRFYDEAFRYLNLCYTQLCRGGAELDPEIMEDWAWLRKSTPGTLLVESPITTLTATATLGSTSVTLSSAPTDYTGANRSVYYWYARFGTNPDVFRVSAHTSGTTAVTLDQVYTGATQTLGTCTLFKLGYTLATDVLRIVSPMRVYKSGGDRADYKIYACDLDALEETYPITRIEAGIPDLYARIGEASVGVWRVQFNRCGDLSYPTRVEYEYLYAPAALTSPGTSEEPVVPLAWRHVLADFLTAYLLGAKNDDRAVAAASVARAGLTGMARENRYQTTTATRNTFRFLPRGQGGPRRLYTSSGIRIL